MNALDIAQVVHDTHQVYCRHIGDFTQVPWEEAPDWQRNSTIAGVKAVIDSPDISPELLHEKWVQTRLADGWVYAPLKNVARKEHPCLIEYHKLDINQKQKDYMFRAVVLACMKVP